MPNNFERKADANQQAINELVILNKIANAINALMSVEDITRKIVDNCLKHVNASQGSVFLLENEEDFKTFIKEFSTSESKVEFHLSNLLSAWMIKNKTIFISNDPDNDPNLKNLNLSKIGINSILSAPLMSTRGLIGTLILFNKKEGKEFDNNDKRFLGIVGSQTAKVIENAQLHEQEKKLQAIQEELKLAHSIQKGFLPHNGISTESCDVCGINIPAKEVGGDYFDIVKLEENRIFISLGDVSGKGVPAALLMANAQAVLRSQLSGRKQISLKEMAASLNHLICQFSGPEQYITTIFGQYYGPSRKYHFVNAGHPPPIVIKNNGQIESPSQSDLIIGYVPDYEYAVHEISLDIGDIVFLYSDGVTETFDDTGREFGEKRLGEFLSEIKNRPVSEICKAVLDALGAFRKNQPQPDDITMTILKVKG